MYNFDKLTERRGTSSVKWDEPENDDVIPMWVADMDFETAPCIIEALHDRVSHGVFGYALPSQSFYDSIVHWYKRRHNWQIKQEWIISTTGVVPAVSAAIKALTMPSEEVLIMTPAYNCFYPCIRNNGCIPVECSLRESRVLACGKRQSRAESRESRAESREALTFEIDWEDFEEKCSRQRVRVMILCNPHNPVGRVWTRDELKRINDICMRHGVTVIADEIHNEIIMPGYTYTPFASVSDDCLRNSITCFSPTKGFNIAGLQVAIIVCADNDLRYRVDRCINLNECCDVGVMGVTALEAAYKKGEDWLDEMCEYVYGNYKFLCETLAKDFPVLSVTKLEGTYLAWIDIRKTGMSSAEFTKLLLDKAHVMVSNGTIYGEKDGEGFIRMNLACPRERLAEALARINR